MSKKTIPKRPKAVAIHFDANALRRLKISLGMIVAVFAFILYAQSIFFDYTLDDSLVINDNKIVQKGIAAIPTILTTDFLLGDKNTELRVPQYRPIPLILFAVEWQFFPNNPHVAHLINVLIYSLSCWLLFMLLCKLFEKHSTYPGLLFPFVCAVLYTAHPIHTDVIDNIKSGDELLCFLFGILSIIFVLKASAKSSLRNLFTGGLCFLISLCSKETGISFLILIPLIIFVFTKSDYKRIGKIIVLLSAVTGVFLIIRYFILRSVPDLYFKDPLLNSIVAAPDFISQKATAIFVLLKYILLLLFPVTLRYDYSFAQIPFQNLTDLPALAGLIIYLGMGVYSIINIRKKNIIAFAILFYLITLFPVSNLLILIGSPMGERFLYMPSLGFCLVVTVLLIKITKTGFIKSNSNSIKQFITSHSGLLLMVFIFVGLYSIKVFSRNPDWKDNGTLFHHDIKDLENNAKAHFFLASFILNELNERKAEVDKDSRSLDTAIEELNKAIKIYPKYDAAYLQSGVAYSLKDDFSDAIKYFEIYLRLNPKPTADALFNLTACYQKTKQYDKALSMADSSIKYFADSSAYNNRGAALVGLLRLEEATVAFQKAIDLNPKFEEAYKNIGSTYANLKQYSKALEYFKKALELNPADPQNYSFIGLAYKKTGDTLKAKEYFEKANRINQGQ